MRASSHIFILCSLLLLVSYVKASLGDGKVINIVQPVAFARRQDQENSASKTEDPATTEAPTKTGDSKKETNTNTDATTGTKEGATKTSNSKSTKIPFDAPAG
ncbi:hypothetical protein ACJ72_02383, partial [Emergomyces africanus]